MAREGWHPLQDGKEGFYRDGICVASIEHDPTRDPPYKTESVGHDGSRSFRNLDTREAAVEHCEWFTGPDVSRRSGACALRASSLRSRPDW